MREVTIDVTQDDIQQGVRENPRQCPIAHASRRAGLQEATVSLVAITYGRPARQVQSPKPARDFIQQFDDHGPDAVQPFAFQISIDNE